MMSIKIFSILCFVLLFSNLQYSRAGEYSTYNFSWLDPDKEVYVLQNRKFRKKRRAFLSGGIGKGLSGAFVDSMQVQGRAGFFFKEEYGIGFIYSRNSSEENDTAKSLPQYAASNAFRRLVESYRGGMFLWSPFYSKANFFNQIFYYDFIIGLGYVELSEFNNRLAIDRRDPELPDKQESHMGPLIDLEMKFFITPRINTSLNVNSVYYQAPNGVGKEIWYNQWDLTINLGFML